MSRPLTRERVAALRAQFDGRWFHAAPSVTWEDLLSLLDERDALVAERDTARALLAKVARHRRDLRELPDADMAALLAYAPKAGGA